MKKILFLPVLLLLLQSCSVYYSGSLPVSAAVAANNKVKVITADDEQYKFKRLEMDEDRVIGIAGPGSKAAKELPATPYEDNKRRVQVDLSDVAIEKIKLRNNPLSTILNIAIPVAVSYMGLLVLLVSVMTPS